MDWERGDGMVCLPKYWWITEVDAVEEKRSPSGSRGVAGMVLAP